MNDIERHIATHTARSAEDRSAVSYLESVLNPGGKINTAFPIRTTSTAVRSIWWYNW